MLRKLATIRTVLFALVIPTGAGAQEVEQRRMLTLAPVFTDHMVVQRDREITVWGSTAPQAEVVVTLGKISQAGKAKGSGSFAIMLPKQAANATGQTLTVRAKLNKRVQTVTLQDVVIGDLWLCTGQSNMRWRVNQAAQAADLLDGADTAGLRLLDFEGTLYPSPKRYQPEFLKQLTKDNYYTTTGWRRATRGSAETFSAVAFVFGQRLARDAGVVIGVIHNAIGGAPMAAFLPSNCAAVPTIVKDAMQDWWQGDGYPAWCRTRIRQNLVAWFDN
ncbi:MAG TPA: hypothetical protein EYP98_02260, partial [Planctomycetes bacterium]|nr:hypothetical protein [Planctomycetota bacterium]